MMCFNPLLLFMGGRKCDDSMSKMLSIYAYIFNMKERCYWWNLAKHHLYEWLIDNNELLVALRELGRLVDRNQCNRWPY